MQSCRVCIFIIQTFLSPSFYYWRPSVHTKINIDVRRKFYFVRKPLITRQGIFDTNGKANESVRLQ